MTPTKAWPRAARLCWLALGVAAVGCEWDGDPARAAGRTSVAALLARSGWPAWLQQADDAPLSRWAGGECLSLSSRTAACGSRGARLARVDGGSADEPPEWRLEAAEPLEAWRRGRLASAEDIPVAVFPLREDPDRSSAGLTLRWSGCLRNDGRGMIAPLALRVDLLWRIGDEARRLAGRPRGSTAVSGIPAFLAPGEFFCVELSTQRDKAAVEQVDQALAVVQLTAFVDGRLAVGPVRVADLTDRFPLTRPTRGTAAALGGALRPKRDSRRDERPLAAPERLELLEQHGAWFKAARRDGAVGWARADDLLGPWPLAANPDPDLIDALRRHAESLCLDEGFCPRRTAGAALDLALLRLDGPSADADAERGALFHAAYDAPDGRRWEHLGAARLSRDAEGTWLAKPSNGPIMVMRGEP